MRNLCKHQNIYDGRHSGGGTQFCKDCGSWRYSAECPTCINPNTGKWDKSFPPVWKFSRWTQPRNLRGK